jgi:hypothetical protein
MGGMEESSGPRCTSVRASFSFPSDAVLTFWAAPADVLDGAMVVLAIYTLNIIHPSCFVFTLEPSTSKDEETV